MKAESRAQAIFHEVALALLRTSPTTGFRVAGALGHAHQLMTSQPAPGDVAAGLGERPARELGRLARQIAATDFRNTALDLMTSRLGIAALAPLLSLVRPEILTELRARGEPAVLVMTHVGPLTASIAALVRLGETGLVLRRYFRELLLPGFDCCPTGDGMGGHALKRAVERVRAGGIVVLPLEGPGDGAPVDVLGKSVRVARGALLLSRLTGAPLVPVSTLWRGDGRIEVAFHEPIRRPDASPEVRDAEVARALGGFVERTMRSAPGQVWIFRLSDLA